MEPSDSKVLNAIRQGQFKQLALYLRHNYDLNITTKDGRNGLFFALDIDDGRRRRRMIRFCLDNGIDALRREINYGYTPLHEAIARHQVDSVQLLLANAGGEIDWRDLDKSGQTILHYVIQANNPLIVEDLIRVMNHYGISVDIPDKNGLTPYLLATKLHLPNIAQILVDKGHASRQQFDLPTHRSVDEWQKIGVEEHRNFVRHQLQEEINKAMKEGKINRMKKLKRVYHSPLLSSMSVMSSYETNRRDSTQSITTISNLNFKNSISINDIIDQLSDGEIPETYAPSLTDEQTFLMEPATSSTLPPITSTGVRQRSAKLTLNALVDLFQVVTEQSSPSYRSSTQINSKVSLERPSRKKEPTTPHRSTLAMIKNPNDTSLASTTRRRRTSNVAIPIKRVA